MSASPQYYECIDETFEEVESKLEELESDPDIAAAEGVLNVTFSNGVVFVLSRQPAVEQLWFCLLYTSPSPRDLYRSRMPSSA